jgi:hypothetical protein
VPIAVAKNVEIQAIIKVFIVALITAESLNNASYHFSENPSHLPPYLDALNDCTMRVRIGKYIKVITIRVIKSDVYRVLIL